MRHNHFVYITLTVFIILSCSTNVSKKTINLQKISIDPSENNFFNFSDIAKRKYRIIELQSLDIALIGQINNIFIKDSLIFILDSDRTKSVFIFKLDGQYVAKISDYGEGPRQYIDIGNFFIDNKSKTINICQTYPAKILSYSYSGEFLNEREIADYARTMTMNAFGNYCLFTANVFITNTESYNLIIKNKNFQTISKYYPTNTENTTQELFLPNNFTHFCDSTRFIKPFCDTVFDISNNELTERYHIDFGSYSVPPDFYANYKNTPLPKINNLLFKKNYAFCIQNYYESKDYLYLKYLYDRNLNSFFIFSKRTGKSYNCSNINNDINYLPLNLYNSFMLPEENTIITIVYPSQVIETMNSMTTTNGADYISKFKEDNIMLYNKALNISGKSNPLIIMYKIKEF